MSIRVANRKSEASTQVELKKRQEKETLVMTLVILVAQWSSAKGN